MTRTNRLIRLFPWFDALDNFYVTLDDEQTQRDANRAVNNLLGTFNGVSQSYPMTMKPTFTYEYFRRQFTEQEGDRTEIMKLFVKILKK